MEKDVADAAGPSAIPTANPAREKPVAGSARPTPARSPVPTPAKPTLVKLKIGSGVNGNNGNSTEPPKIIVKQKVQTKPKKPKQVDMPPPPYIDDGSHDLLQEVIALEEMKRVDRVGSPSKPRKVVSLDADDELLGLAVDEAPALTEAKAPIPEYRPEAVVPPKQDIIPPPRRETPKPKRVAEIAASSSRPGSSKGKEKEGSAPPRTATPPKTKHSASPPVVAKAPTTINEKKCRDILKNLSKLPQYAIFSRPVDTVLDGCPEYGASLYMLF